MAKTHVTAEEHTALPDALKAEYAEGENGRFVIKLESDEGFGLANVEKLTNSAGAARTERDNFGRELKGIKAKIGDFDLGKLPQAREALEKMDDWDPDEKLKAHKESFEASTRRAFETEFGQKEKLLTDESDKKNVIIASRTEQLKRALFESSALQLCSQFSADPSIVSVMRDRRMVNWEEDLESHEMALVVVDTDGQKRLSVSGGDKMGGMSLEELFKECQGQPDKWGIFFKPPDKTGSGAGGSSSVTGGFGENPFDPKSLNLTKQGEMFRADPERARRLAAAAGIKLPEIPK